MRKPPDALYGLSANHIAQVCRVDISTARRWKSGAICLPQTALMIITRDLGCFAAEWRGWTINGEDLVSPDGWCVNRNDALIVPLMHGQISALRQQVASLQAARDDLEDQPLPGELPAITA